MIELFIGVVVGVVIGWHVEQPSWAREACKAVKSRVNKLREKIADKLN